MQSFSVDGASVVVVGGGSGIGKAIATASAAHGADVTIASRNEEKLKAAAAEIGDRVQSLRVDMTDEASVA
ncbi:MAG: SDR family NAD(P)-dependent oxidoreductase, partial [Pseudomonadota bacterium]